MITSSDAFFVLEIMKEVEFPEVELLDNSLSKPERADLHDIFSLNPEEFPEGFTEKYSDRIEEIQGLLFRLHEDAKHYHKKTEKRNPRELQHKRLVNLQMLQNQLKKLEDLYYHAAFHQGSDSQLDAIKKRIHQAKRKIIILKQS